MKNGINLQNINNLRKIHGLPYLIELPPIPYPENVLDDSADFAYDDLDASEMEIMLYKLITDVHYEYIAFYPEWIRFFDSQSIKGE